MKTILTISVYASRSADSTLLKRMLTIDSSIVFPYESVFSTFRVLFGTSCYITLDFADV